MSEKLVRDKIVEYVKQQRNEDLPFRIASEEEIVPLLKKKILEEAQEVFDAKNTVELAEELADLLEVIRALASKEKVVEMMFLKREAKHAERGGFEKGVVLLK